MKYFLALLLIFCRCALADLFEQELAQKIHFSNESNLVGYLYIGSDHRIDHTTYVRAKLALDEYKKRKVLFVLCRLNTPGGDVLSARRIAELLQQMDHDHQIPVVGMIYNWALSSGAMIAYSCRFLVCTQNALMGARNPFPIEFSLALKNEFARLAAFFERNPLIAEAMIDPGMLLVKRGGQIVQLNSNLQIQPGDQVIKTKGKPLSLDADQMIRLGVVNALMPIHVTRTVLNEELKIGEWPGVQSRLFHLPFFSQIPNTTIIDYHSWKVNLLSFLTHEIIDALFLIGLMISLYLNGLKWPLKPSGFFALAFFALIVVPNGVLGEIPNWGYILFGMGIGAIFFFQKIKAVVVLGLFLILIALFGTLVPEPGHFPMIHPFDLVIIESLHLFYFYLAAFFAGLILIGLIAHARKKFGGKTAQTIQVKPIPPIGTEGEAFTSLRPNGKARIGFHLYDALTHQKGIERGEKIVVKGFRNSSIIVEKSF